VKQTVERVVASLGATCLALLGLVVLAGPAGAHHPVVTGDVACQGNTPHLDWSAQADAVRGKEWKINSATVSGPGSPTVTIETGTWHPDSYVFTGTTGPVAAGTYTLTVNASWRPYGPSNVVESGTVVVDAEDCRPPQPPADTETREVEDAPDCTSNTVTTEHQERTRDYSWDGDSWEPNPWSDWTTTSTTTRQATDEECPPPPCDVCALPVVAGSQGDAVCDGALVGGVYDDVTVRRGTTCVLADVHVNGSVLASAARNLLILDATIRGSVVARDVTGDVYVGSKRSCAYDPLVGGSLTITGSHNVLICRLVVCKDVRLRGNDGRITVQGTDARKIVVRGNRHFVSDGDVGHVRPGLIRLLHNQGTYVVANNAPRHVLVRP
jgi:hypothetical protein